MGAQLLPVEEEMKVVRYAELDNLSQSLLHMSLGNSAAFAH